MNEYDKGSIYKMDKTSRPNVASAKSEYSEEYDVPYNALTAKHIGEGFVAVVDTRRTKTVYLYGTQRHVKLDGEMTDYWWWEGDKMKVYVEPLDEKITFYRKDNTVIIDHPQIDAIDRKRAGYKEAPEYYEAIEIEAYDPHFEVIDR